MDDSQLASPRAIIHLDMDAFYASVEQRDDPALRGKPVIVGGHRLRGVVLAASYEVRPFGVGSAMPMARALKLAPHAIVCPPRFSAYAEASERVFEILKSATPLIEPLSLDEAFLDVTASRALFGAPAAIATELRKRIAQQVGLPSSAGIAEAKMVAKIASDAAKPNGQIEVAPGGAAAFLAPLPLKRLWGVGPKTAARLEALGLRTIGDIAARDDRWLKERLGDGGSDLGRLARGIDDRPVVPDREAKSIGAEDTFEDDLVGVAPLIPRIHEQALRVGFRLRRAGLKGRTVQLKIKLSDFRVFTRRRTIPEATDDGQLIYRMARELLQHERLPGAVRLTGVAVQSFESGAGQLGLFERDTARDTTRATRLNAALDRISERFGRTAVTTADLTGQQDQDHDPDDRG